MKQPMKVIEPNPALQAYRGAYQEIAVYVRELLQCDCALVALPGQDSIRIQGYAAMEGETYDANAADVISQLRDWGPVVVDDARLIAAPVCCGDHVLGVLIGFSSSPGKFTADDLSRLMQYTHVAAGVFSTATLETPGEASRSLGVEDLLHFSRLITMGELSASFAHEVANPLTLIRGHIRFIEETLQPDDPIRANFDVIVRASRRIEEMARRMLDFSKKRPRRIETFNLADLISDAIRFVQPYYRPTFLDVQVQVDAQLSPIRGDRWQIMQAVVNIIQNATDAMAGVERRVLTIKADLDRRHIRIVISDIGPGIRPEHIGKIFEPFFTTKGDRGTGLGLYVTRQIIEQHHGTVDVQTGDRGTSFVISLPL